NSLDCYDITWSVSDFETAWGNPKTTKQMIDTVKSAGFNAIRIPVSWTDHLDNDGNIDSLWLKRVQQVVDYAMDNNLYTILNMHHDDYTWLTPIYYKEEEVTQKYIKVWSQIADRFKNYDTKLLFEGLNEPRIIDSDDEWTGGTAEERDVINHLLQAFVDTIRNSGGKNSMRTLIITTQAASISESSLNGLVVPDDDNLILSIHNYAPWKFTSYDFSGNAEFTQADKEELDYEFSMLNSRFVSRGLPVIIGEFGAENKNNTAARAEYYEYYIKTAAENGIPCFIWDNNTAEGEGSYGMLNRSDCSWYFPEIIEAVQDAIK
ncbi:MAG: glycoside hydrolase family 5 protein, partial [Oscillospiraceae bacterium]|nr:glycoside hydrolase family 5 protein [Oscillospiraceae bacterium]